MGEEGPWVTLKRSELRDVLVRAHECLSESLPRRLGAPS